MPNNNTTRQRANNSNPTSTPAAATPAAAAEAMVIREGTTTVTIKSISVDKSGESNGVFFETNKEFCQKDADGAEIIVNGFSKSRETLLKELEGVELAEILDIYTEGAPTMFDGYVGCLIPILKGRTITIERTLRNVGDVVNGFDITKPIYTTSFQLTKSEVETINKKANEKLFDRAAQRLIKKSFDF